MFCFFLSTSIIRVRFLLIARWNHSWTLQLFAISVRDHSNVLKQIYKEVKVSHFVNDCYIKSKGGRGSFICRVR